MKKVSKFYVGIFKSKGEAYLADPCYISPVSEFDNIQKFPLAEGDWKVEISTRERVTKMTLTNLVAESYNLRTTREECKYMTGAVDSGQWGVFNVADVPTELEEAENWYTNIVCPLTLETEFGIVGDGEGAVTSSGWGDGCYPVFVWKDDWGTIVKITIDFDDEAEHEEQDEW